ncbi:DUF4019 domain-containing protein [Paraburkholderia rhynchosiae]|uniref:DUF4019 domain-containing protein n=1 Tax=Paraburkholderia rhynchosiae TaxID=487049 RepID=A0A2N7WJ75_9BURK|nr:DUF4019 domain-containing protein [Paraburkholderia rhynchosiae]PMS29467.1 hypothetical protein C0Z16_17975 [Paraburkholderia rhynchosiae]CAB3705312.1 hypothetical protein LMG27174_03904 [Paraburkholderia rhynchosiae]
MKSISSVYRLAATCMFTAFSILAHAAPAGASPDQLLQEATLVLQQIDASQYTALWQETVPFVRSAYTADSFAKGLTQSRQSLGTIDHRSWASITRLTYLHDKSVPDGVYANVDYATQLRDGRIVYEKVSFQLASDGRWLFTGYAPRQDQVAAMQP